MSGTVNHHAYRASPWGNGSGNIIPPWLQQLDKKPVWIALTVLGFIAWWPLGLALLIFLVGSGRMGCGFGRRHGGRHGHQRGGWARGCWGEAEQQQPTTGNRAFDEYRAETLRRLEEEQREFAAFLDRLRFAKDKAEFDAFMADRRRSPQPPDQPNADQPIR
jgi:hypothetical protein